MNPLDIQVTYDFICPWCWIGHAHLKAALREANLPSHRPSSTFRMNSIRPCPGRNRSKSLSQRQIRKLGTFTGNGCRRHAGGQTRRCRIQLRPRSVTPNTRLAHRLMFLAQSREMLLRPKHCSRRFSLPTFPTDGTSAWPRFWSASRKGRVSMLKKCAISWRRTTASAKSLPTNCGPGRPAFGRCRQSVWAAFRLAVHNRFRYSLKCFDMPPATQPPKPPSESPLQVNASAHARFAESGMRAKHNTRYSFGETHGRHHKSRPRALIIGGSLGGAFTATTLQAAGWDVDIFERSPSELDSRGVESCCRVTSCRRFISPNSDRRRAGVRSGDRIYPPYRSRHPAQLHAADPDVLEHALRHDEGAPARAGLSSGRALRPL